MYIPFIGLKVSPKLRQSRNISDIKAKTISVLSFSLWQNIKFKTQNISKAKMLILRRLGFSSISFVFGETLKLHTPEKDAKLKCLNCLNWGISSSPVKKIKHGISKS